MKILFLHISDLHISYQTHFSEKKIEGVANVLRKYRNIEKIFLICTGDVADTGDAGDYKVASVFFSKLISTVKKIFENQYIYLYIVPGNHDIKINYNYNPSTDDINDENLHKELKKNGELFFLSEKEYSYIE